MPCSWNGQRREIAVAVALSLPASPYRDALVTAASGVAMFTVGGAGPERRTRGVDPGKNGLAEFGAAVALTY
jgi:hypothetical protein